MGKDKEFMENIENGLFNLFYDKIFTNGLRKTVVELPFIYILAKDAFYKRYAEKLPEHQIAL